MTTPNQPNSELIEEIHALMKLSSMNEEERTAWTVLLPNMTEEEIEKFHKILLKEITKMNDILLRAKEKHSNKA